MCGHLLYCGFVKEFAEESTYRRGLVPYGACLEETVAAHVVGDTDYIRVKPEGRPIGVAGEDGSPQLVVVAEAGFCTFGVEEEGHARRAGAEGC